MGRQPVPEVRPQLLSRWGAVIPVGCGVGDEAFVAVVVGAEGGGGLGDVGVGGEGVFDFAEFDAVAADFDLVVGAAEVVEVCRRVASGRGRRCGRCGCRGGP